VDELDQIILRSANKIIVESLSVFSGHPSCNNVRIIFSIPQELSIIDEEPFSRLTNWTIGNGFWDNNRKLEITRIPETINADEIAHWLAKGKIVELKRWAAPSVFQNVEI
jgi:hypothetical protein